MPDIIVNIAGKGKITFPEGTSDAEIESTIDKEFPRDGVDVASDLSSNPDFEKSMSIDDFKKYKDYLSTKETDWAKVFGDAVDYTLNTAGKAIEGTFSANTPLNPAVGVPTAIESAAEGTRSLYGVIAQSEDPNSILFKFKNLITNTGSEVEQLEQFKQAREFSRRTQELESGKDTLTGISPDYINNDVKNALAMIADPTMLIPVGGEILGIGRIASKAVGAATKGAGKALSAVSVPISKLATSAVDAGLNAVGADAGAIRSAVAATGTTAAVLGNPVAQGAALAYGGIKAAEKSGSILAKAGENLMNTPTRIGPLESLGLAPNASAVDRVLARVGRYGGDAALDLGLRSAVGSVEGSAIGGGLGYLSGGEEGAAAGAGSGFAMGAGGAGITRAAQVVTGRAALEARAADLKRFIDSSDSETKAKFESIVKRDGVNGATMLMDGANLLKGALGDAVVNFLNAKEFAAKHGVDARGVQYTGAGDTPSIDINIDHGGSAYTFGHELFHVLDSAEQLKPISEKIKQQIVGTYITDNAGVMKMASAGMLSEADVLKRFDEYKAKLKAPDERWTKANRIDQKAALVGQELGSEYMAKMLAGSSPDALLRGFDGIGRGLLDSALMKDASSRLGRIAEKFGIGANPVDSMLFKDLENASPALNASLRELVRARKSLDERMVATEDNGVVINPKDITSSKIVADKAVKAGLAEVDAAGNVRVKTDDELHKEEQDASSAIVDAVNSTTVSDPSQPHLRIVDGEVIGGGASPEQLAAIKASPKVSDKIKQAIELINKSLTSKKGEGNVLGIEYAAALRKVLKKLTGKYVNRYSSGIRMRNREIAPYQLYVSKAGNFVMKAIDVSKLRLDAQRMAESGRLGPYQNDFKTFMSDVTQYFEMMSDPSTPAGAYAGLVGDAKAAFMHSNFGAEENGGSKYIRDYRLDRLTDVIPTNLRIAASERAWQRQKVNWMPSEKLPNGEVTTSKEGYRIIKTASAYDAYDANGEKIGKYSTQAEAEKASNKKIQSNVKSGKEFPVINASKEFLSNFMPAINKVDLINYADRQIICLPSDRMGIGMAFVGPTKNKKQVSVASQGGRGFMYLFDGKIWAFTDESVAGRFLTGAKKGADKDGNVIVGITIQSPINHIKNKTGQLAYLEAIQAAIESRMITKKAADAQIKAMSDGITSSDNKSIKPTAKDKFSKIKTLNEFERAVRAKILNFEDTSPLLEKMQNKKLPISEEEQKAIGIHVTDIARDLADPELRDVPFGSVVALFEFNVNQTPELNNLHYTYPATISGKPIGYLNKFYNISDLTTEPRVRNSKGVVSAQPLQTVLPIMDNIFNTIKEKEGIPSVVSERNFMPSDVKSSKYEAILKDLNDVGFIPNKLAIASIGKFPDYLLPVAQHITDMREKLISGGISLRDLMKSYMMTIASQGAGAVSIDLLRNKLNKIGVKFEPSELFVDESGKKIRPEEAAAYWLGTENGQKALNNLESGKVNPSDWSELVEVRKAFGDNRFKTFNVFSDKNVSSIPSILEKINSAGKNKDSKKLIEIVQELNGISTGKKGFIGHLLGVGDVPTIDAVEINFWLTGKGSIGNLKTKEAELARKVKGGGDKVSDKFFNMVNDRINAIKPEISGAENISNDVWAHVAHHLIWDRAKGIETTHKGMYHAAQNYMPAVDTKSENFKSWFGDSKIVDEKGNPLRVVHGSKEDIDTFKAKYEDGLFFFSTNPDFSSKWALNKEVPKRALKEIEDAKLIQRKIEEEAFKGVNPNNEAEMSAAYEKAKLEIKKQLGASSWTQVEREVGASLYPVYLSIKKPFDPRIDYKKIEPYLLNKDSRDGISKLVKDKVHKNGNWIVYEDKGVINELKRLGYDGLWISESVTSPKHETIAAFYPEQIKSAISNTGEYSKTDARINQMPAVLPVPERFTGTGAESGRQSKLADVPPFMKRFDIGQYAKGGKYFDVQTGEDLTGKNYSSGYIDVSSGKPVMQTSDTQSEKSGTGALIKTNLFKQKAGWKWVGDAPAQTSTLVSVEKGGNHYYTLKSDFASGIEMARYSDKTSEPRLRPTTRGDIKLGTKVGSISIRGKVHPVYDQITLGSKESKNLMPATEFDYRGQHTAPSKDAAPAYDLTGNEIYPKDVYQRPDWYENGEGLDEMRKIQRLKGNPEAPVWIHRAIPKSIAGSIEGRASRNLNAGDWVSTSKKYAMEHGEGALNGDYVIVSKRVKAKDIHTNGDSIFEWGYNPESKNMMPAEVNLQPQQMPNGTLYMAAGGYKIIQQTGGNFRLYSPTGTLVAVNQTLEDSKKKLEKILK